MNAEEKFEEDVLLELKKHATGPWSALVSLMHFLFIFCNNLLGYSAYVRFLEAKYHIFSPIYDMVFFIISRIFIASLADLYGRRRVGTILTTYTCLMLIPITIFTYFKMEVAFQVVHKMHSYLWLSVIHVQMINFLELNVKCNKLTMCLAILGGVCSTETIAWKMNLVYRRIIVIFFLTLPVFFSWYTPESPMWLLNKNRSRAVLQLLDELSGKQSDIAVPTKVKDDLEHSQFKIWKESLRYLFKREWKNLLLIFLAAAPFTIGTTATRIVHLKIHSVIPFRILLVVFCILIIIVVFITLRLRLGVMCINGTICFLEMVNFCIISFDSSPRDESVIISWLQFVLGWSGEIMTLLFVVQMVPTFVRAITFSLFNVVENGITAVLVISGLHDLSSTNIYMSGTKIFCYIVFGIVPWLLMREPALSSLPNQKLMIP